MKSASVLPLHIGDLRMSVQAVHLLMSAGKEAVPKFL